VPLILATSTRPLESTENAEKFAGVVKTKQPTTLIFDVDDFPENRYQGEEPHSHKQDLRETSHAARKA
jgi:hypothetical protein